MHLLLRPAGPIANELKAIKRAGCRTVEGVDIDVGRWRSLRGRWWAIVHAPLNRRGSRRSGTAPVTGRLLSRTDWQFFDVKQNSDVVPVMGKKSMCQCRPDICPLCAHRKTQTGCNTSCWGTGSHRIDSHSSLKGAVVQTLSAVDKTVSCSSQRTYERMSRKPGRAAMRPMSMLRLSPSWSLMHRWLTSHKMEGGRCKEEAVFKAWAGMGRVSFKLKTQDTLCGQVVKRRVLSNGPRHYPKCSVVRHSIPGMEHD